MKNVSKYFLIMYLALSPIFLFGNDNKSENDDTVTVHVYRPKKMVGFAWVFNLKLNGEKYDKIKNGDHLVFNLKPGKATFSVKKKEVVLDLKLGETYYLRSFIAAGVYIGSLDLVEVTESFAKKELGKIDE